MKKEIKHKLYGAILGDLCGQPYEFPPMQGPYTNIKIHNPDSKITDDSIMTLATAYALLKGISFEQAYKGFGVLYDGDYYGSKFKKWIREPMGTIGHSHGNGCIMRVSPIMYLGTEEEVTEKLLESCICSHLYLSSINSVLGLHTEYLKSDEIRKTKNLKEIDEISPFEKFIVDAYGTLIFVQDLFHSTYNTYEAIIKAVECGGDTDTNASIIGELMNYTYNDINDTDVLYVESKLDPFLLSILKEFNKKY